MNRLWGLTFSILILSSGAARSVLAEETSFTDGLSVGAEGTLGNHGGGGALVAEHRGEHDRIEVAAGVFAPSDGSSVRILGNLGGFYCFGESGESGFCAGAPDLLHSNGTHMQLGFSPVGFGFINGENGSSLYVAPRYAYILDEENKIGMHSVGADVRADIEVVEDALLFEFVGQLGIGFGTEGYSSEPVVREIDDTGYFYRASAGLRWVPIDALTFRGGIEVSDSMVTERNEDDDIAPMAPAILGNIQVQYAF